ncbi:Lon protease family protein [Desulfovibrio oxyclinae]|uniref:Lon protease family protein n=1 Tax=Desulfovibrio oxyclinae TaxID=63560 RepID=UPI00037527A4|nr:AAA family ATPase [Desulfovibrio oxyclinae]
MAQRKKTPKVPVENLRLKVDPSKLGFKTTDDIEPLTDIIGQQRGVEAFRFGMGMRRKGYNIFVTGEPGTGRLSTVRQLLKNLNGERETPDDLCYVNNFKKNEYPILLRFEAGQGNKFKKAMQEFVEAVKREAPQLFESEEYIQRKNEIHEAHEKKVMSFYKAIEDKVKDTGLVMVRMQMGPYQRPDIVPLVDNEPKRMIQLEEMVENGRFPREEFERLKELREKIKHEVDDIVQNIRDLNQEVNKKHDEVDRLMFLNLAEEHMAPVREEFPGEKVGDYLDSVLDNMVENLDVIKKLGKSMQGPMPGMMMPGPDPDALMRPYSVNLLVDNSEQEGPPVIIESYPTYRNLFGSIDRTMERHGGWHTDFSRINAGSFVKANGGYLVINLMDAIMEPGVWQTLKRSLKTEKIEIETYDPYYFITAIGLKPEPIDMEVKVVVLGDNRLYQLLRYYDQDMAKIFKVRADYESSMDRDEDAVNQVARFIRHEAERDGLRPFAADGVAAVLEQSVRMAGRQEKLTTAFPKLSDLLAEADHFASVDKADTVGQEHVRKALEARVHRTNQIEERIQEMIDRGSLFVDTDGEKVGQVNGLAVYSLGDYAFGKPSRITATTGMGKAGIINIEREADMSGPTHNKGVLILAGYLREMFAQDKPISLSASLAFEQSYGGIDGDSASSTELYALLSSLSGIPLRQDIAVTGSVNQRGEVQPIGGVNEKIEGFYLCCKHAGLTGDQGVMVPEANVKDLMLLPEVVDAVKDGKFNVWSVKTIAEGIELLTGVKAGTMNKSGKYTANSVFRKVNDRLLELAEGLRDFGKGPNDDNGKNGKSSGKKSSGKKT